MGKQAMQRLVRNGRASQVALAAVAVVGFGLAAYLFLRQHGPPEPPGADEGRVIAEEFLEQVRAGKPSVAWEMTTADFKSFQGREAFARSVAKLPGLKKPLAFVSMQRLTVNDQPRSEYLFSGEKKSSFRVLLGNERGAWKVDRLTAAP